MKQVLYFFPLNPADKNAGSISRAIGLLQYFKSRGISVDFASKQNWGQYTPASTETLKKTELVNNIHILRRKPVKTNAVSYFLNYKIKHLLFERKLQLKKGAIPNHTTLHLRQQFDTLLSKKKYDYIIISYAYWADLIKENELTKSAVTIIDTHDFLSAQHQLDNDFDIKVSIGEELRRLSLFDQIWTVSSEETYLFKQFFKDRVKFIPIMMDRPDTQQNVDKIFDLIYVASDNPHNLISIKWFFEKIFPQLSGRVNMLIIGPITSHVKDDLPGVQKINYAENLSLYYHQSRIAICPMLSGTGMKVKVIEAMAHGLPIVCTTSGVDGMLDKSNNGCFVTNITAVFAEAILNLKTNTEMYKDYSNKSKRYYEQHFETNTVYNLIDDALNNTNA